MKRQAFKAAWAAIFVASIFGCGGGGGSTAPNESLAYLEAPPANIAPSPSDGQSIGYAILNPQGVPTVQCPNDPAGSGLIICDGPGPGQMATLCILWANINQFRNSTTDYLGACKN